MPLMSTCLGRLGSRYSLILDPNRLEVYYGSLGLMCQSLAELVVGIDDGHGHFTALPLSQDGSAFYNVDQHQSMTSVTYVANCVETGVKLETRIIAPFWPGDEKISSVPAYVVTFRLSRLDRCRWEKLGDTSRKGVLRFGLKFPDGRFSISRGAIRFNYPVAVAETASTGEGGLDIQHDLSGRKTRLTGSATDMILPLEGVWRPVRGMLEIPFDVSHKPLEVAVAMASHCPDALFERLGEAMPLQYTRHWGSVEDVAEYVKGNWRELIDASDRFDAIWSDSSLSPDAQDLAALSFQSYLMCTLWATQRGGKKDWFSVWEGSCWFNSTVDVTYNEAMFYFTCWPELLEKLFEQWSHHVNDKAAEARRRQIVSDDDKFVSGEEEFDFPGAVMEHDMGAGWTANGQSYHHMMPVEENSNFLLMLYAHGKWWGREKLFKTYAKVSSRLAEYLLWTDSTGNGFPDRGTANTIDDATPAVQYGRDNVYLGIKRLAALHAAARMLSEAGDEAMAKKCDAAVRTAVKTLNAGWLGDHWGVCLDKSAKGLIDCWTREPLPYDTLPGWDAYSLYTTNGLVPLMLIDDLPAGLADARLQQDVRAATDASMTRYGCGHSSMDKENMWVSMNVWRDIAAGYLGIDMLEHAQRYWKQQLFANGVGSEKPNCFTETSLTNNLVWYPRNAAIFGLHLAAAGLKMRKGEKTASVNPILPGRWPLLPLADWAKGKIPTLVVESTKTGKLTSKIEDRPRGIKIDTPK